MLQTHQGVLAAKQRFVPLGVLYAPFRAHLLISLPERVLGCMGERVDQVAMGEADVHADAVA